jgi:hypothetical protein
VAALLRGVDEPTILRDIAGSMMHRACDEAKVKVQRAGKELEVTAARVPIAGLPLRNTHDVRAIRFK